MSHGVGNTHFAFRTRRRALSVHTASGVVHTRLFYSTRHASLVVNSTSGGNRLWRGKKIQNKWSCARGVSLGYSPRTTPPGLHRALPGTKNSTIGGEPRSVRANRAARCCAVPGQGGLRWVVRALSSRCSSRCSSELLPVVLPLLSAGRAAPRDMGARG